MENIKKYIPSPCIKICQLKNNICTGCYRNLDEIKNWTSYTENEKIQVIEITKKRQGAFPNE